MILTDIRTTILNDPIVSQIIGTRFFYKAPIDSQTQSYLTYHRQNKERDMVSEHNRFQIIAFSKDVLELETLTMAIIDALEGKKVLNNNEYYSNSLIGQTDSREKLDDGFFWSIITFEFKHTT